MPSPNMARSARKNRGGKRPGAGRKTDAQNAASQKLCQKLLARPLYQQKLAEKLDDGTLHPTMQSLLWYYAYGKPRELLEVTQITPVRVQHVYDLPAKPDAPT